MTLFLATSSSPDIDAVVAEGYIGRLCSPRSRNVPWKGLWAADNGCYSAGDTFSFARFVQWLVRMRPHQDRCLFAVAPDVVGDHEATLERSLPVLPLLRDMGYPAAFVAQDGSTPARLPWGEFDVLFIGGTTEFKLGPTVRTMCDRAYRRRVPVHVGRVNSERRFMYAHDTLHAMSVDGTHLSFGPGRRVPEVLSWQAKVLEGT